MARRGGVADWPPRRAPARSPRDRAATQPDLRVGRGAVVGLSVLALAASGHAVGGGRVAFDPLLLVVAAVSVACGIALSDREWRLPRLLLVLTIGQAATHVVLVSGQGHAQHAVAPEPAHHAGIVMIGGHVAALLVTAVVIRHGESVVLGVAAALGSRLFDGLPVSAGGPWPASPLPRLPQVPRRRSTVLHAVVRRGPPSPPGC